MVKRSQTAARTADRNLRSALYTGDLWHARSGPRAYHFTYGVYYLCIDLSELNDVDRRLRLLSYGRANVLSVRDEDHENRPGQGLATTIREHLKACGYDPSDGHVSLLTNARVFGYVFNPVSFYLLRDTEGALLHVIAEVHNTHGERHLYDLCRQDGEEAYRATTTKEFYVSPFIDMHARYEFELREREGRLTIRIDEYDDAGRFFRAVLLLSPRPMTDRALAYALVRYPLMTLRTIALIHWQGLKLWLRGEPYRRHTKVRR